MTAGWDLTRGQSSSTALGTVADHNQEDNICLARWPEPTPRSDEPSTFIDETIEI